MRSEYWQTDVICADFQCTLCIVLPDHTPSVHVYRFFTYPPRFAKLGIFCANRTKCDYLSIDIRIHSTFTRGCHVDQKLDNDNNPKMGAKHSTYAIYSAKCVS
jgi:hypothetical protein